MKSYPRLTLVALSSLASLALWMSAPLQTRAETAAATPSKATVTPVTDDEKAFYALGLELAHGVSVFSLSPRELDLVMAGFRDGSLKNKDGTPVKAPLVDREDYRAQITALAQARQSAEAPASDVASEDTPATPPPSELPNADLFMKEALKEKGSRKLMSGVIFTVLRKVAHGRSPSSKDTVTVHYRGTLLDGTEFDSSYKRGEPTSFPLNAVIPCWTQGVGVMKVGEKARLICPSNTAYGKRGSPPTIPADAALLFEVELLSIESS
jgi:FKBP-type peptidyl-prolyl cis-trans isomerase FkpA